jgi:hypothetical protein
MLNLLSHLLKFLVLEKKFSTFQAKIRFNTFETHLQIILEANKKNRLTKPWQLETKKETMQKYVKYFY